MLENFLKTSIQNVALRSSRSRNVMISIISKDGRLFMRKRGKLRKKLNNATNNDRFVQLSLQISGTDAALVNSTSCESAHKEAMAMRSTIETYTSKE